MDVTVFDQAHLDLLAARAGEPIVTDADETEARFALAATWELVVFYGSDDWSVDSCPGAATQVLIEAAARLWMNLGGFESERADAVTLGRSEMFARGAELSDQEKARLERAAGRDAGKGALRSVAVSNPVRPVSRSSFAGRCDWVQPYGPFYSGTQTPIPYMRGDEESGVLGPWNPRVRDWRGRGW